MKVQYKKLKRKQSVTKLVNKHGTPIINALCFIALMIVILCGGFITGRVEGIGLVVGCVFFCGYLLGLIVIGFILLGVANYLWRVITYVRAFFRYTYLPLTIEEVRAIKMDESPITFIKILRSMICYRKHLDDEQVAIRDNETEQTLSHLFYQLFFYKDETQKSLILEWLNDKESRKDLKDAMKMVEKERFCLEKERSLLDPLNGFYKVLDTICYRDEIVIDVIAFDKMTKIKVDDGIMNCKAILYCKDKDNDDTNWYYLIGSENYYADNSSSAKTIESYLLEHSND